MTSDGTAGPYAGFEGKVGRTFAGSTSWWPERAVPPKGAPHVVIIVVDDLGYSDLSCYGSEIPTPNLDSIANAGLQLTNFHVTPMCSPTRAALLTGVNPHRAGAGHVANSDPGFPGYAAELAEDVVTIAEHLRASGYATFALGKWHLTKDADMSDAGPRSSWPLQRGFDRYYGFLDAFTNLHHPHRLVVDNHTLDVDTYPEGYFLTDDLTDQALSMMATSLASHPEKPFFCYLAEGAVHAPLHCKPEDLARHRGRYDEGWDVLRERRFRRQKELGVIPAHTTLGPRNSEDGDEVPAWDSLDASQQRLYARYMEVYAAMVDNLDQNVGRLLEGLARLGVLDNTVVMFLSDNGASREGEKAGTSAYLRTLVSKNVKDIEDLDADLERLDLLGGPQTMVHYPRGWAMVSNTPWRLYKINTHAGGHSVAMLMQWPARPDQVPVGQRRDQWAFVTDIAPTLLEWIGVTPLTERAGVPAQPFAGVTMAPSLAAAEVPHPHREQYFEMNGHRGFYSEGWEIVTRHQPLTHFGDHEWELYDLSTDPAEQVNLANQFPERVADLAERWERAAWANQVYPLEEGSRLRYVIRPPYEDPYSLPATLVPPLGTLERYRSQLLIQWRSFVVDIDAEVADGNTGTLIAHGDQGGGYAVYLDPDGHLRYVHNGYGVMTECDCGTVPNGPVQVQLQVTAPGDWTWNVALSVNGEPRCGVEGLVMLGAMAPFCGIDVGADRRSPVSWSRYVAHGAFPFDGTIHRVRYVPGERAPDAGDRFVELLRQIGLTYE